MFVQSARTRQVGVSCDIEAVGVDVCSTGLDVHRDGRGNEVGSVRSGVQGAAIEVQGAGCGASVVPNSLGVEIAAVEVVGALGGSALTENNAGATLVEGTAALVDDPDGIVAGANSRERRGAGVGCVDGSAGKVEGAVAPGSDADNHPIVAAHGAAAHCKRVGDTLS